MILIQGDKIPKCHRKPNVICAVEWVKPQLLLKSGNDQCKTERVKTRLQKLQIIGQSREFPFLLGGDLYTAYTFIAVPGSMYLVGAVSGFFAVPYTVLIYPLIFVLMPRFWSVCKQHGYVTAADFVKDRFGSRGLALAIAFTGILATMPYIALQLVGIEVVLAQGQGCCGSLVHHLGREQDALAAARRNIDAWTREIATAGLDAVLVTASGCGTTVKDYGFMLRGDSAYAGKAARISALARDISEYLAGLELSPTGESEGLIIAYHSACSLQHGQKIARQPKDLLCKIGFVVKDVPEGHLCCGSAGTYNILQPDIARRLRDRKVGNIEKLAPDVIAAGNIGCITQIAAGTAIPVVHTVELIDWATGGRRPEVLMDVGF